MDADEKICLVIIFSYVVNYYVYDVRMKYDTQDNEAKSDGEQAEP